MTAEELEQMQNLDLSDFSAVQGLTDNDYIILVLSGGTSAKIAVSMFRKSTENAISPSIKDGVWWIGQTNTEVEAEGRSPEFMKGELGIYWKYTTEDDDDWKLLVNFTDITWTFDDLTSEQKQMLIPHLSDFSEEEIAELQQPANDMIAVLEQTNEDIKAEEAKRVTAEDKRVTAENSRVSAENSRASEFATLRTESKNSTDYANEVAQHPTYVGEDNYIYEWNHTTQTYDKTYKLVKAGGLTIDVQYSSVAELEADSREWNDGLFAMVNTNDVENPEDARLYIRKDGAWEFVVDMSGAIGLTGKTPQLFIGSVSLGKNLQDAGVALSYDGTDDDGNPKYNINFTIPRLTYDDLTDEQIAELQKPASDMIATLQAMNDSIEEAESKRVSAESSRVSAESKRVSAENARVSAESSRVSAEKSRVSEFTAEKEKCDTAAENANTQANRAKDYADHPSYIGDNGNWYVWDESSSSYKDTGVSATGDFIYPTFDVDDDMNLCVDYADEDKFTLDDDGYLVIND